MPLLRGQSAFIEYTAWDFGTQTGKTGDAGNHTLRLIRDGIESIPTNAPVEIDSANLPGLYQINVTAAEMDARLIVIGGKSSSTDVSIIPTQITTD